MRYRFTRSRDGCCTCVVWFQVLVKLGPEEPRAIQVHPYKGWLLYMCCLVSGVGEAGSGGASRDTGSPVQGLVILHGLGRSRSHRANRDGRNDPQTEEDHQRQPRLAQRVDNRLCRRTHHLG